MNAAATLEAWSMALMLGAVLVAVAAGIAFGLGARIRRGELAELVTATTISIVAIAELTAAVR
jgi:ABC-type dipeptide/oligopeptide/nickel transport system permease component